MVESVVASRAGIFVAEHWPDFTRETFEQAIAEYRRRERRFGGLAAQTA